jgi:hypothetical protein
MPEQQQQQQQQQHVAPDAEIPSLVSFATNSPILLLRTLGAPGRRCVVITAMSLGMKAPCVIFPALQPANIDKLAPGAAVPAVKCPAGASFVTLEEGSVQRVCICGDHRIVTVLHPVVDVAVKREVMVIGEEERTAASGSEAYGTPREAHLAACGSTITSPSLGSTFNSTSTGSQNLAVYASGPAKSHLSIISIELRAGNHCPCFLPVGQWKSSKPCLPIPNAGPRFVHHAVIEDPRFAVLKLVGSAPIADGDGPPPDPMAQHQQGAPQAQAAAAERAPPGDA